MNATSTTPYISKSKFLWGLQCHKLLWHAYNAKHLIPGPDAQQQAIFDQGHEVGDLSTQLFPSGIEVANESDDFDEILKASQQAVKQRTGPPVMQPSCRALCIQTPGRQWRDRARDKCLKHCRVGLGKQVEREWSG